MITVSMNAATKKLSLDADSVAGLNAEECEQAQEAVELVNRLMSDLVANNGDIPPPPNQISSSINAAIAKHAQAGTIALKQGKIENAIEGFSAGIEAALQRPLWEAAMMTFDQVASLLAPRCDAYIAAERLADAYADASMLLMLKPLDATNHFRKGTILHAAGRSDLARHYLETARNMVPTEKLFREALESLDKETA